MDERQNPEERQPVRLRWAETLLLIYSFFRLFLPWLLVFLGATLLVAFLLMLWLR
jgi:hypothetical protein